ncbi:MAG: CoA transferase subunit A [Actinobacteria bacterium]|nr:CoA transferase subunit A [Actinomycetota bacterium]
MYEDLVEQTEGQSELFCNPDPDLARENFKNKSRALENKVTTVEKAVSDLVEDGDYIATGGFGHVRIPTAILYEVIRQKKRNLGLAGHTSIYDSDILASSGCLNRCDISYVVGYEIRGLSACARRAFQSDKIKKTDWSNSSLSWRFWAASAGLSFVPSRSLLGTDTFKHSAAKTVTCPFTGKKFTALPALYPDVGIVHVSRADIYGNCQIDGILISDEFLARASRKVIISTERLVSNEEIRLEPHLTVIPYWCVDAVVEVPFGSHPGNMPEEYWFDEDFFQMFLGKGKTEEGTNEFFEEYVYGVKDFDQYLEKIGGIRKMNDLRAIEKLIFKKNGS